MGGQPRGRTNVPPNGQTESAASSGLIAGDIKTEPQSAQELGASLGILTGTSVYTDLVILA